jgi:uncharacterized protein (DUF2235 family)
MRPLIAANAARWPRGIWLCALLALAGCSQIAHKQSIGNNDFKEPRKIVVFFDGTHNDEIADTNVKRLHSLVTLQNRENIDVLYIEGVGTGVDVAGMGAGLGMAERVRVAYEFLMQHWRRGRGDEIYLVGFSRGAYTARVLNSLLYHAGIVEVPKEPRSDKTGYWSFNTVAVAVYGAVDAHMRDVKDVEPQRRKLVGWILKQVGLKQGEPVPVKVLALWDTVEATGVPNFGTRFLHKLHHTQFRANIDEARPRYGDKLCNVEYAFQAHSLDDDREWIFTPLLLTRQYLINGYLINGCDPDHPATIAPNNLREVWFAGAHADVGGGYRDSRLSGVSLNWMIRQLEPFEILPKGTQVREDVHGTSHDPDGGTIGVLYHNTNRDLAGYALGEPGPDGKPIDAKNNNSQRPNQICVDKSVFERRKIADPKSHENHQLTLRQKGEPCLVVDNDNTDYAVRGRWLEVPKVGGSCPPGAVQPLRVIEAPCEGVVK